MNYISLLFLAHLSTATTSNAEAELLSCSLISSPVHQIPWLFSAMNICHPPPVYCHSVLHIVKSSLVHIINNSRSESNSIVLGRSWSRMKVTFMKKMKNPPVSYIPLCLCIMRRCVRKCATFERVGELLAGSCLAKSNSSSNKTAKPSFHSQHPHREFEWNLLLAL